MFVFLIKSQAKWILKSWNSLGLLARILASLWLMGSLHWRMELKCSRMILERKSSWGLCLWFCTLTMKELWRKLLRMFCSNNTVRNQRILFTSLRILRLLNLIHSNPSLMYSTNSLIISCTANNTKITNNLPLNWQDITNSPISSLLSSPNKFLQSKQ